MNLPSINAAASGTGIDDDIRIIEPLCAVFRRRLKAEGLKYTPERAHILDAIMRRAAEADSAAREKAGGGTRGAIFEADELVEAMRRQGFRVSRATVYRTIKLLAEAGIIEQVPMDSDQSCYQLAHGRAASGVLVDAETGEATPFEIPELEALRDRICRERGMIAEGHRLVVYGRRG
ncbi:MAG: transcriptional repressor [Phycisphaeraceae bacterium]|nr:transcriptional repressor [Phycisphaeraceae bacterium]MBX3405344.1 transcriptional repressor [Phycisphaeraceae bacterium]